MATMAGRYCCSCYSPSVQPLEPQHRPKPHRRVLPALRHQAHHALRRRVQPLQRRRPVRAGVRPRPEHQVHPSPERVREEAAAVLRRSGRSPDDISSVVLVEKDRSYIKSDAVLRIMEYLNHSNGQLRFPRLLCWCTELRKKAGKVKEDMAMLKAAVLWRKSFGIDAFLDADLGMSELEGVFFYRGTDIGKNLDTEDTELQELLYIFFTDKAKKNNNFRMKLNQYELEPWSWLEMLLLRSWEDLVQRMLGEVRAGEELLQLILQSEDLRPAAAGRRPGSCSS